jgi:tetratricopeptide (TPR) repeat protein
MAVHNLGTIALIRGDTETARKRFLESLQLDRELSDTHGEAFTQPNLALAALEEGGADEAAGLLESSLRIAADRQDKELIFWCLVGFAEVAAQRDDLDRAARLLGAADALRDEMGYGVQPLERKQRSRIAAVLNWNEPELAEAKSNGYAWALEDAVAYALDGACSDAV